MFLLKEMLLYNKITLFRDFALLNLVLRKGVFIKDEMSCAFPQLYSNNKFAMKHYTLDDEKNIVRIWRNNAWFDCWYDSFSTLKCVGCLDYTVEKDHVKIDYISVNDDSKNKLSLTEMESMKLMNSFVEWTKLVAKENGKPKIVVDVHYNLKMFEKYFGQNGFIVTTRKCQDNPYWIETELQL